MITRLSVERRRAILIRTTLYLNIITPKALIEAVNQVRDDEYVIEIVEKECSNNSWGSDREDDTMHNYMYLVVGKKEDENDVEYFKRVTEIENRNKENMRREKNEYLRLKAKYEDAEMIDGTLTTNNQ